MTKKLLLKGLTFMIFPLLFLASYTTSGQIVVTQEMPSQYVEKICGNSVEWYN